MIPELGHFALILALLTAAMQLMPRLARRAAFLSCGFLALALAALLWSCLTFDFTVVSVAENTHTLKSAAGHIAATMLNPDTLSLTLAFALSLACMFVKMPNPAVARALAGLSVAVIAATLFIAHPFARIYPPPFEGIGYEEALAAGEKAP